MPQLIDITFSFKVLGALTVLPADIPDAMEGQAYSHQFEATGGTPPYAWRVTDGALPIGIELSEDGLLAGTPAEAGEFAVTVTVSDSGS